jgi:hypothetical protein
MRYRVFHPDVMGAQAKAESAKDTANAVQKELSALKRRTDFLSVACQAMWELLCERANLTDKDIQEKIQEVDLRDGNADGKISGMLEVCSVCGQNTNNVRKNCLYCGAELSGGSAFSKS